MEAWEFMEDKCSRKGASMYKKSSKGSNVHWIRVLRESGWDGGKAVGRGITGGERVEKARADDTLEGWPGGKTRVREGKEGRRGADERCKGGVSVVGETAVYLRWEHRAEA